MRPDLVRVEIPVRWEEGAPPTHPGRALNAWFYGVLARRDDALAAELHQRPGPKPFAIALANLRDEPNHRLIISGCGPLVPHVQAGAEAARRILLDGCWLAQAGEPRVQGDGWGELASRCLITASRLTAARLEFLTPTTFHSRGRTLPLPVPDLVFGGLLQRWQAWSSVDLGETAAEMVAERTALRRHRLWSVMVQMEGRHAACLGWAEFILVRPDPAYTGLLALLSAFAEYAGVGQKTAMGFGCVRSGARTSGD